MSIMRMDRYGLLETDDLAEQYGPTHAGFVKRARRALDKLIETRAANARDPRLSAQGARAADLEAGKAMVAGLAREAGGVMLTRLMKSVPYRAEQLERAVWPPRPLGGQTEAARIAGGREIRDFLRSLSDDAALTSPDGERVTERTKVLRQAALDGDAEFMLAVIHSPPSLRLFGEDDVAHAKRAYITGAISRLPESQTAPLTESQQALGAFEQIVRAVERASGAQFDQGSQPEITMVG